MRLRDHVIVSYYDICDITPLYIYTLMYVLCFPLGLKRAYAEFETFYNGTCPLRFVTLTYSLSKSVMFQAVE